MNNLLLNSDSHTDIDIIDRVKIENIHQSIADENFFTDKKKTQVKVRTNFISNFHPQIFYQQPCFLFVNR